MNPSRVYHEKHVAKGNKDMCCTCQNFGTDDHTLEFHYFDENMSQWFDKPIFKRDFILFKKGEIKKRKNSRRKIGNGKRFNARRLPPGTLLSQ